MNIILWDPMSTCTHTRTRARDVLTDLEAIFYKCTILVTFLLSE